MKVYICNNCSNPLYFENSLCLNCKHTIGFDASKMAMITLETGTNNVYYNIKDKNESFRFCENAQYATCNWLVPTGSASVFCVACELNRVIPDLTFSQNLLRWKQIEVAKHRLVYSLLRLGLPVKAKLEQEDEGIAFDFLSDISLTEKVMTGHDNGIITINIDEADEAERVRHKNDLGERYRTLLGHFRHEVGHYYWDVIMKNPEALKAFRKYFGNEQLDYATALETYYANGAVANWDQHFISPYATSHPWEDWAETWAHYLHMIDTLETAYAFGVAIDPVKIVDQAMHTSVAKNPYKEENFDSIINEWMPLSFALNSLNRSMGHQDFYPFFTPLPVIEKLRFIHDLLRKKTYESVNAGNMPAGKEQSVVVNNMAEREVPASMN